MRTRAWRTLLLLLALACGLLLAATLPNVPRSYDPGVRGTLDLALGPTGIGRARAIKRLGDASPLAQHGARVGDLVVLDHPSDGWRYLAIGEPVGLTLIQEGQARHLQVWPVPDPELAQSPRHLQLVESLFKAAQLIALVTGALMAWRQAASAPLRALAATFLCMSIINLYSFWPAGPINDYAAPFINAADLLGLFIGFAYFCLAYPEERPPWRMRWVRSTFWSFAGFSMLFYALRPFGVLGLLPAPVQSVLVSVPGQDLIAAAWVLITVPALWWSWRGATGLTRQRLAWFGLCLGAAAIVNSLPEAADAWLTSRGYGLAWGTFAGIVTLASLAGMAWALLRHRLIDIGFALNRVSVHALLALALLGAAVVAQIALSPWLDPANSVHAVLNGLVTGGIL